MEKFSAFLKEEKFVPCVLLKKYERRENLAIVCAFITFVVSFTLSPALAAVSILLTICATIMFAMYGITLYSEDYIYIEKAEVTSTEKRRRLWSSRNRKSITIRDNETGTLYQIEVRNVIAESLTGVFSIYAVPDSNIGVTDIIQLRQVLSINKSDTTD